MNPSSLLTLGEALLQDPTAPTAEVHLVKDGLDKVAIWGTVLLGLGQCLISIVTFAILFRLQQESTRRDQQAREYQVVLEIVRAVFEQPGSAARDKQHLLASTLLGGVIDQDAFSSVQRNDIQRLKLLLDCPFPCELDLTELRSTHPRFEDRITACMVESPGGPTFRPAFRIDGTWFVPGKPFQGCVLGARYGKEARVHLGESIHELESPRLHALGNVAPEVAFEVADEIKGQPGVHALLVRANEDRRPTMQLSGPFLPTEALESARAFCRTLNREADAPDLVVFVSSKWLGWIEVDDFGQERIAWLET